MSDSAADLKAIKANAIELIPFLRERAADIDALNHLPDDVVAAIHDAGCYRIYVPADFGGLAPVPLVDQFEIIRDVAKGNGSAAWSVSINLGQQFIPAFGEKVAREVIDPAHVGPLTAGTIFMGLGKAEARAVDGGYMLKGSWGFASNVWHSAWLQAGFNRTDEDGNVIRGMALIPRAEFQIADDWHVQGLKGSGSNTAYTDTEVFVPAERALDVTEFFTRVDTPAISVSAGLGIGALIIGCAHGALESFIEIANKRPGWGGAGTIASMPTTQATVAKVRARISLAESALQRAAEHTDKANAAGTEVPVEQAALYAYEGVHALHLVRDVVGELEVAIGSSAAAEGNAVSRFVRDIRVAGLHGLVRPEPRAVAYGQSLLGLTEPSRLPFGNVPGGG